MDHEIEMEESSNDPITQHFEFLFCVEDDFPKSRIHRIANSVESDSEYSSYTSSSATSSPAKSDSSGSNDEELPHSRPSKLQQDNCHHANQITVTPIKATPASNQTRNTALYSAGSEIKSTGIV